MNSRSTAISHPKIVQFPGTQSGLGSPIGQQKNDIRLEFQRLNQCREVPRPAIGNNTAQLVADLHHVRDGWAQRVKARRDAAAWKITEIVVRQPVVNAPSLSRELGIPQTNVYRALQPLVDAGVLVEFTNNKRDRLWRAPDVLEALDAFAARTGRRQRPRR